MEISVSDSIQSLSLLGRPSPSIYAKLGASNITKVAYTLNCVQEVVKRQERGLEPRSHMEQLKEMGRFYLEKFRGTGTQTFEGLSQGRKRRPGLRNPGGLQ